MEDLFTSNKLKAPLFLLLGTALFNSSVQAEDWIIGDGSADKTLTDESWNGNIIFGENSQASVYLNNSVWQGDWQGSADSSYSIAMTNMVDGSQWVGNAQMFNSEFNAILSGNSLWQGNIHIIADQDFGSSNSNVYVNDGSHWQGDSRLESSSSEVLTSRVFVGVSSSWIGNSYVTNTHPDTLMTSSISIYDATWTGDVVIDGLIYPDYDMQSAQWTGNIIISNNNITDNYFTGNTSLSDSHWTGYVDADTAVIGIYMNDDSRWTVTGDSLISDIYFDSSNNTVEFSSPVAGPNNYHTLTVGWLDGNGDFTLRAGFFGPGVYGNDKLVLTETKDLNAGDVASQSNLTVINNGSDFTNGTETLTIVETADGIDNFTMSNDVELGGYVYSLERDDNNWILRPGEKGTSWQPALSSSADAAANSLNVGYLLNYAENQTLIQSMGDLRQNKAQANVWLRGYSGSFDSFGGSLLKDFDMRYNGLQFGADKQLELRDGQIYFGALLGLTNSNQSYKNGDGTVKNQQAGLYASYMMTSGLYLDSLVKYNHMKNDFSVSDSAGNKVSGDGTSNGIAASISAGQRFYLTQPSSGFYLEPQAQYSFSHQGSSNIQASNGLRVDLDSYNSSLGRVGANVGYEVKQGKTPVNIYMTTSYLREFDGKSDMRFNGSKQQNSFKGEWWSNGVGVTTQINKQHNLYLDMERATGNRFNQNQINAGYRVSF